MNIHYEAACGSNQGRIRNNNEDNLFFGGLTLPEKHGSTETMDGQFIVPLGGKGCRGFSVAVFDGMGGEADGEIASFTAANVYRNCLKEASESDSMEVFLATAVQKMSDEVAALARKNYSGMGTTAVALCFLEDCYYLCNVGDSRAFLLREGGLSQISVDHTDILTLQRLGITERKPSLSQYIGMYYEDVVIEPYIAQGQVLDGDQFLICSDGLTDMVEQDAIEHIMRKSDTAHDCAERLISAALEHGGRDNVTVTVVRIRAAEG